MARHARWGRGFCRVHRLAIATLTRVRAVIFSEFGVRPEVREAPDPEPAPDGVVIEVEATGVCRSDWHSWQGHDPGVALPHVAGHELAGRIAALGVLVSGWQVGDRVTVPFVCACGSCAECASGNQQICDRQFQPGATHWGSFAEFVAVDYAETNLVALPQDLSSVHAAALGCRFATAFRALLRQGNVRTGQWVAVYGCGGAGISAVMLAVAAGAQVVAVDLSMLETIRQFGEEQLVASGEAATVRSAHARHFAKRETDILAQWDSPRQREAYDWFATELANQRSAFRWAADHNDLDVAATIAAHAGLIGALIEKIEPVAWAEEVIEPARAADHPLLPALYAIASQCWMAGRIDEGVRYTDAAQIVLTRRRDTLPYPFDGMIGGAYMASGHPERWIEWCRAQLQRGGDTTALIQACLVFGLVNAGSGEEAMDASKGLIEAAEAAANLMSRSPLPSTPTASLSATSIPPALLTPSAGACHRSRQWQPVVRNAIGAQSGPPRGRAQRHCIRVRSPHSGDPQHARRR